METKQAPDDSQFFLVVRRTIRSSPERVFEAWTNPAQLKKWWGPKPAVCPEAEIDLRVGGKFRIGNLFPDGSLIWILGEFTLVDPPRKLVYTWRVMNEKNDGERPSSRNVEQVSVTFKPINAGETEITVIHEKISDEKVHSSHERGWVSCLEGLYEYLSHA